MNNISSREHKRNQIKRGIRERSLLGKKKHKNLKMPLDVDNKRPCLGFIRKSSKVFWIWKKRTLRKREILISSEGVKGAFFKANLQD